MGRIEPELTSTERPLLIEKYKNETPQQAAARAERYQKAFVEYDQQYAAYMQHQQGAIRSFQTGLLRSAEKSASSGDESVLGSLESAMNDAVPSPKAA